MSIKCLIVDDNKMARLALQQLVSQVDFLEYVGECASAIEAFGFLQQNPVDLILLDIEMPNMTGLELTRHLTQRPIIIFTTSKKEYAVEAFELNVADYIVKPITVPRFLASIERAKLLFDAKNVTLGRMEESTDNFIFIRDSTLLKKIMIEDLLWLEAMGDYVKVFYRENGKEKFNAIHITLKALGEKLPSTIFQRVHRSYIVAVSKIDYIEDGAINIGKKIIPIADAYRSTLNKRLNLI
jgi:two-component system, LytTR family, response regulator